MLIKLLPYSSSSLLHLLHIEVVLDAAVAQQEVLPATIDLVYDILKKI